MAEKEPWLTDPDVAYMEAERRIAKVRLENGTRLNFRNWALWALPPEISNFGELRSLNIAATSVGDADLELLKPLASLQELHLSRTKITDAGLVPLGSLQSLRILGMSETELSDTGLASLSGLVLLEWLNLRDTYISEIGLSALGDLGLLQWLSLTGTRALYDLRPLLSLGRFSRPDEEKSCAIYFSGSSVADVDPIKGISVIADNNERIEALFAHLRTLPPYPLPIDGSLPKPKDDGTPKQKSYYQITPRKRDYELAGTRVSDAVLRDPMRQAAYQKLDMARVRLRQGSNQFSDIDMLVRGLDSAMGQELSEAHLPLLHMEVETARGIYGRRSERKAPLDDDLIAALHTIGEFGSVLTLNDPQVAELEADRRKMDGRDELEKARVADMAQALADNPGLVGQYLQLVSEGVVTVRDIPAARTEAIGSGAMWNFLAVALAVSAHPTTGSVGVELLEATHRFCLEYFPQIEALAQVYGDGFVALAESARASAQDYVSKKTGGQIDAD